MCLCLFHFLYFFIAFDFIQNPKREQAVVEREGGGARGDVDVRVEFCSFPQLGKLSIAREIHA